jgi:hypothetical protein
MIKLFNDTNLLNFYNNKHLWKGCFGGMSIITHDYLMFINNKHDISKLLDHVLTRYNRCSFERVIACLLQYNEKKETLLGNIHKYCPWGCSLTPEDAGGCSLTPDDTEGLSFDKKDNYKHLPLIKVWTGR